jgi:lipase maturation factor 1
MIVNPYGLFAVMTTERPEITIEGSRDGSNWREYVFKYKLGPLERAPLWNMPHQPRLDWQMWFAALDNVAGQPWFASLLQRLLEGSPEVLGLLKSDSFADKPPKYVQALIYDYRFATPIERSATAAW